MRYVTTHKGGYWIRRIVMAVVAIAMGGVFTLAVWAQEPDEGERVKAKILNPETPALSGSVLQIRFRSRSPSAGDPPEMQPEIDVFDPQGISVLTDAKMKEAAEPGIYEYHLTFDRDWGAGKFTIMGSDPGTGRLDSLTLEVFPPDLASQEKEPADLAIYWTLVESEIARIDQSLDALIREVRAPREPAESLYGQLLELRDQLRSIGVVQGNERMMSWYGLSGEHQDDRQYLRQKIEDFKVLTQLGQKILLAKKKGQRQIILTRGSDIFIANPSLEEQKIDIKAELPRELKRENIKSADGLKLGEDQESGLLWVEGEAVLQTSGHEPLCSRWAS